MSKHNSRSEMFSLIDEWTSSNQTQLAFCQLKGLAPSTFSYWRKKYLEAHDQEAAGFTEVLPEVGSKIEVCYPNGVKVTLPEQGSSLPLIQALVRLI